MTPYLRNSSTAQPQLFKQNITYKNVYFSVSRRPATAIKNYNY